MCDSTLTFLFLLSRNCYSMFCSFTFLNESLASITSQTADDNTKTTLSLTSHTFCCVPMTVTYTIIYTLNRQKQQKTIMLYLLNNLNNQLSTKLLVYWDMAQPHCFPYRFVKQLTHHLPPSLSSRLCLLGVSLSLVSPLSSH